MFLLHTVILNLFTDIIYLLPTLANSISVFFATRDYKCFTITFRTSHPAGSPFCTEITWVKLLCVTISTSSGSHHLHWAHYHHPDHHPAPITFPPTPSVSPFLSKSLVLDIGTPTIPHPLPCQTTFQPPTSIFAQLSSKSPPTLTPKRKKCTQNNGCQAARLLQ